MITLDAGARSGTAHISPELERAIASATAVDHGILQATRNVNASANLITGASLIIACGGQDVPPDEVISWIAPLLRGLPRESWFVFTLTLTPSGLARATCIDEEFRHAAEIVTLWPAEDHARFRAMVPGGEPLTVVLMEDAHSQIFALLDVVSDWLCRFEPGHCEVQSLFRLVGAFQILTGR